MYLFLLKMQDINASQLYRTLDFLANKVFALEDKVIRGGGSGTSTNYVAGQGIKIEGNKIGVIDEIMDLIGPTPPEPEKDFIEVGKNSDDYFEDGNGQLYKIIPEIPRHVEIQRNIMSKKIELYTYIKYGDDKYTVIFPVNMSFLFGGDPKPRTEESVLEEFYVKSTIEMDNVKEMEYWFSNCNKLRILDVKLFDTSNVTNMTSMFAYCRSLTSIDFIKTFKTTNLKNMSYMFAYCTGLTGNITFPTEFNTSGVTDMSDMFTDCNKLTNITFPANFNTSSVINMNHMFYICTDLTNITFPDNIDTSNVTNMSNMVGYCRSLTSIDFIKTFKTTNLKNMSYMFTHCTGLTGNITFPTEFNTSGVTDMSGMFSDCANLNSITFPVNFNTSSVTDMGAMFANCTSLTNITFPTEFNTSSLTDISLIFYNCSKLQTVNMLNFDVSKITETDNAFFECTELQKVIIRTDTNNVIKNALNNSGIGTWERLSTDQTVYVKQTP